MSKKQLERSRRKAARYREQIRVLHRAEKKTRRQLVDVLRGVHRNLTCYGGHLAACAHAKDRSQRCDCRWFDVLAALEAEIRSRQ